MSPAMTGPPLIALFVAGRGSGSGADPAMTGPPSIALFVFVAVSPAPGPSFPR